KDGRLSFKKDLLADMLKANQLAPQFLEGPFGGKLTLLEITQLEPSLTADNLAKALTLQRMNQIYWAVVNYTNQRPGQFFSKDKWVLSERIIVDALKSQNIDPSWARDIWGQPIRLEARAKPTNDPWGQPQFQFHELVSAGPDRKFGTKDDLK